MEKGNGRCQSHMENANRRARTSCPDAQTGNNNSGSAKVTAAVLAISALVYVVTPFVGMTLHFVVRIPKVVVFAWLHILMLFACITVYVVLFAVTFQDSMEKYLNLLSESEEKWRTLAQEVGVLFEPHGITVETVRASVVKHHRQVSWTVGLVFSFRVQPTDDDGRAWCIANCQTDDVSDDEFQSRGLRITKELEVLQAHSTSMHRVATGSIHTECGDDLISGEKSSMPTTRATAVIDDGGAEAEDRRLGDGINKEMWTLLHHV